MKSLMPLKVAILPEEQYPQYEMIENLIVILADFMGCAYQIVFENEGGRLLANGSWSGCLGLLNRSEADISVLEFLVTPQRSEGVEFLHPIHIGELTFATKRPIPSANPNAIFQPFSTFVWVLLAVSMLAMAFVYLYVFRNRNFSDSAFSVLATASRQAPFFNPKTSSERIVMGSWIFGMTIITAGYMGLLLSYLTFPNLRIAKTILDLATAIEDGDYQCFTYENNPFNAFLLNSSLKSQNIIGKNLIESDIFQFEQSSATNIAFITARDGFTDDEPEAPQLFLSEDTFFTYLCAFAARKDFPFKDKLNWVIRRLIETGIYNKMFRDYNTMSHLRVPQLTRNLSLLDFKSVFIMLLIGYGASIIILLLEILALKLEHLKTRKKIEKEEK